MQAEQFADQSFLCSLPNRRTWRDPWDGETKAVFMLAFLSCLGLRQSIHTFGNECIHSGLRAEKARTAPYSGT